MTTQSPYQWHRWFSWYPVKMDYHAGFNPPRGPYAWRWLCTIERRIVGGVAPNGDLADGAWLYRSLDLAANAQQPR